jgi:hypothetical protein
MSQANARKRAPPKTKAPPKRAALRNRWKAVARRN